MPIRSCLTLITLLLPVAVWAGSALPKGFVYLREVDPRRCGDISQGVATQEECHALALLVIEFPLRVGESLVSRSLVSETGDRAGQDSGKRHCFTPDL